MIELQNVSKYYNRSKVLDSINLVINPSSTTVLIGPSGSGKSTVLRILVGLVVSDTGRVVVEGEKLDSADILRFRHKMGYVIQEGGLFPHMDSRRNVTLMPSYLGWEQARIDSRLEELCDLTKFPRDALSRFPLEISGGQRERVSLMRALMLDPDILLLDEPLGALDPLVRFDLQNDLREIFQTLNKTVVLVTHDLGEAAFFGDEIVLMNEGTIAQQGPMTELVQAPKSEFVKRFVDAQRTLQF